MYLPSPFVLETSKAVRDSCYCDLQSKHDVDFRGTQYLPLCIRGTKRAMFPVVGKRVCGRSR